LLGFFDIPRQMLPDIRPSSTTEPFGMTVESGPVDGELPITGIQAHLTHHGGLLIAEDAGEAKNTYGTGNFLLLNTGEKIVR
ncbi:glycerol kinase, partial [Mycobacterium sp. ITM-2017-0098]